MAKRRYHNPAGRSEVGEHRDALLFAPGGKVRGRGAGLNPGNRFETVRLHVLGEHLDAIAQEQTPASEGGVVTQLIPDKTQTIINRVQCPDMGFQWTVNPYRGCEHGCIYCYARTYHEYLGFSSGIDFETRIMVKYEAPELLRRELAKPSWQAEPVVMSAITDCWQPLEVEQRLARRCLEVLVEARQPVTLLTRNRLILRDLDLLTQLARHRAVRVMVSLTTLDNKLAAVMEPRASSPHDRLRVIGELARAGVPVMAMFAPVVPALTDKEIPGLLAAAAEAGAKAAGYCMVRLPYQNKALFFDWLERNFPDRVRHVESRLREMYQGKLYASDFSARFSGAGAVAQQVRQMYQVYSRRHGLHRGLPALSSAAFRRPLVGGQMALF